MNLKYVALMATALIASSVAVAQDKPQQSCSSGSCSKKGKVTATQSSCSKKEAADTADAATKDTHCAKKEASCSKSSN